MSRWFLPIVCMFGLGGVVLGGESSYVFPGDTGRLLHYSRPSGDRVPNFSAVGYRYGDQSIPAVPTSITVSPSGGDDTDEIQAAINAVAMLPLDSDGFRGAVQLSPGEFLIRSSINIRDSGVVLRGSGNSDTGTVLRATGTSQRSVVNVVTGGNRLKNTASERSVRDKYVPVGATSFHVDDASSFQVGDAVVVYRPSTANWISDLGMDMIPPRSDGGTVTQWTPGSKDPALRRESSRGLKAIASSSTPRSPTAWTSNMVAAQSTSTRTPIELTMSELNISKAALITTCRILWTKTMLGHLFPWMTWSMPGCVM